MVPYLSPSFPFPWSLLLSHSHTPASSSFTILLLLHYHLERKEGGGNVQKGKRARVYLEVFHIFFDDMEGDSLGFFMLYNAKWASTRGSAATTKTPTTPPSSLRPSSLSVIAAGYVKEGVRWRKKDAYSTPDVDTRHASQRLLVLSIAKNGSKVSLPRIACRRGATVGTVFFIFA